MKAIITAPKTPMEADSVGEAIPNIIEPKTPNITKRERGGIYTFINLNICSLAIALFI
jgi:hypothetical protein